jgi:hypothetical protein
MELKLTNLILSALNDMEIPISNCRGQSYDNSRNMSRKYSGVQQRIKYINPFHISFLVLRAPWILSVHVRLKAASVLFHFSDSFKHFSFFSASTNRWKLLTYSLRGVVPKYLSGTRWSARSGATGALKENYERIYSVL